MTLAATKSVAALADPALVRFLRDHRLAPRVESGRAFSAPVGAPARGAAHRAHRNVIRLGGYYQLAVRRRDDGALEVGMHYGRRHDLSDAVFLEDSAHPLVDMEALRAACRRLARVTA